MLMSSKAWSMIDFPSGQCIYLGLGGTSYIIFEVKLISLNNFFSYHLPRAFDFLHTLVDKFS